MARLDDPLWGATNSLANEALEQKQRADAAEAENRALVEALERAIDELERPESRSPLDIALELRRHLIEAESVSLPPQEPEAHPVSITRDGATYVRTDPEPKR